MKYLICTKIAWFQPFFVRTFGKIVINRNFGRWKLQFHFFSSPLLLSCFLILWRLMSIHVWNYGFHREQHVWSHIVNESGFKFSAALGTEKNSFNNLRILKTSALLNSFLKFVLQNG